MTATKLLPSDLPSTAEEPHQRLVHCPGVWTHTYMDSSASFRSLFVSLSSFLQYPRSICLSDCRSATWQSRHATLVLPMCHRHRCEILFASFSTYLPIKVCMITASKTQNKKKVWIYAKRVFLPCGQLCLLRMQYDPLGQLASKFVCVCFVFIQNSVRTFLPNSPVKILHHQFRVLTPWTACF